MIYVLIPTTKGRRDRLAKCVELLKASVCSEPITICTYENSDGGFVPAIHKMLEGIKDDSYVFCIGDDCLVEPDCLQKLWDASRTFLGGCVQPLDRINKGEIAVAPFCPAILMKKYQFKGYMHNFCDVEFTTLIKEQGLYLYVPEAKVYHEHFHTDRKLYDATYDSCQRHWATDELLYHKRKAAGFEPKNTI